MTRARFTDTEPTARSFPATDSAGASFDRTDPGSPPELAESDQAPPLTTEADLRKAEQLIEAFKRPPQRPMPAYAERAQSEGGNAVGYRTTAHASPGVRVVEEREKVLVELASAARSASRAAPSGFASRAEVLPRRDQATEPSGEKRLRRQWMSLGLGALVAAGALAWMAVALRPPAPAVSAPRASAATSVEQPTPASLVDQPAAATSPTPSAATTPLGAPTSPASHPVPPATARPGTTAVVHAHPPSTRHPEPTAEPPAPSAAPLKDQFWP